MPKKRLHSMYSSGPPRTPSSEAMQIGGVEGSVDLFDAQPTGIH